MFSDRWWSQSRDRLWGLLEEAKGLEEADVAVRGDTIPLNLIHSHVLIMSLTSAVACLFEAVYIILPVQREPPPLCQVSLLL